MYLSDLNKIIELQAKIYEMPNFDLAQVIQKSKTSPKKMFDFFASTKQQQQFTLFPILERFVSKSGKVILLILPDEKCIFMGQKDQNHRNYYHADGDKEPSIEEIKKTLLVDHWVLTEQDYAKRFEVKVFLYEKTKGDVIDLIKEIIKAKAHSNNKIYFGQDPEYYSLQSIRSKVRETSIIAIVDKIEIQLGAYGTLKCLSKVVFDMPSVETSRIAFTSDNHSFVFVYPCQNNPSKKLISEESKKPEVVEDAHYWFPAIRDDWSGSHNSKISEGIQYFMDKKDWFEFSIDGKKLKVEMKDSKRGTQRVYVDTIPTRTEEVIPALLSLVDKTRVDVIYDLDKTHKLSPEMEAVLKKGLYGHVDDLEDTIHISAKVVRHGNKYFLQSSGKEYQLEGGFQTVKKLQSCLDGSSKHCARWEKIDVSWGRDSKLFIDLLVESLGEEKGIEVYQLLKKKDEENKLLDSEVLRTFIDKNSMNISKVTVENEPCYKIRIKNETNIREFYFYGFKGFELYPDGKKHDINNLRSRLGDGENHSDDDNILFNFKLILDGKAEVNDYGF